MERKNYVKPNVVCNNLQTVAFMVGSTPDPGTGGSTNDSSIAMNIIERCFRIEDNASGSDIDDDLFEKYLLCENTSGIILKCDNTNTGTSTVSLTNNQCYLVTYTKIGDTKKWNFTLQNNCNGLVNANSQGVVTVNYGTLTQNCDL